jgi:hypothetical protein
MTIMTAEYDDQYDEFERFVLGAEQLIACRDLLSSNSPAKHRMAVILLDSLVDALLWSITESIFRDSDEAWYRHLLPQYSEKQRARARAHLSEKLKISSDRSYSTEITGTPVVMAESDVRIIKVGHSYRNAAYHRDEHNPVALASIGRAFLVSVCTVFIQNQVSVSTGTTSKEKARLLSVGVDLESVDPSGSMLNLRDAATGFANRIAAEMKEGIKAAPTRLAEDLIERIQEINEDISYIDENVSHQGDVFGDIDGHLEWIEFWALVANHDPELRRLRYEKVSLDRERYSAGNEADFTSIAKRRALLADAHNERFKEIWSSRQRSVGTRKKIERIHKAATRLATTRSTAMALELYRELDVELGLIARYIRRAVIALDQSIQDEIDRIRGK